MPSTTQSRYKSGLWDDYDHASRDRGGQRDTIDPVMHEVVKYLSASNADRGDAQFNPLKWWHEFGKEYYPRIYEVAKKHLIVPATSVPSGMQRK